MLHHLEAGVWHTALKVAVRKLRFAVSILGVGPSKDGRDHDEGLLFVLMLMKRLSQNLNNLLSFFEISAADQVDHYVLSSTDALAESLGLALTIDDLDLLIRGWYIGSITLDKSA